MLRRPNEGEPAWARLGGVEFTTTSAESHDIALVTDIAQKQCNALARPFIVRDETAYISVNIGITIYPRGPISASELLRNADQAMYRSKKRERFIYFEPSMQDAAHNRMAISNERRSAVGDGKLQVWVPADS